MKLISAVLVTLMMASVAQATPGDTGCEGLADGKKVDVLIGYDNFGEGASLLEISLAGKKIFSSTQVREGMVNVGTKKNPFMIGSISADDKTTDSSAVITWPEQTPSDDGSFEGVLNLSVKGKEKLSDVEIKCER